MKTEIIKDIRQGFETAYINGTLASNLEYKPSFVSNNPKEGKKVISTIEEELLRCEHFQISVAFITMGGITPLLQTLKELERKGVVGEILTTNYLNFSEPRALEKLNELSNITLKMYDVEVADSGFHTKGYIFKKEEVYRIILGSSNMTSAALTSNIEWNTKIISSEQGEVASEIIKEFNNLWNSDYALDFETFYEIYKVRYELIKHQREEAKKDIVPSFEKYTLKPNSMQEEFIINLRKIIEKGEEKALLISATGTGKTYASAFAVRELGFKRVLFIVHRAQLAKQAKKSFERVFNNSVSMGIVGDVSFSLDSKIFGENFEVLPLGIGKNAYRMQEDILFCKERGNANSTFNELVVMSPFLSESVIADFNLTDRALSDCKRTLVTRRSELGKLKASDVDNFTIYALKDEIIDGEEEISDELADKKKQNIHAKIYLRRKYSDVDLYLGSMNASYSAINKNVEMMLWLGTKNMYLNGDKFLEDIFCGPVGDAKNPFEQVTVADAVLETESDNRNLLEQKIKDLCRVKRQAVISEDNENAGKYKIEVEFSGIESDSEVTVSPFNSKQEQTLSEHIEFSELEILQLSEFYEITARSGDDTIRRIIMIPTSGFPDDRESAAVNSVVKDRASFVEYIAFVLGNDYVASMLEGKQMGDSGFFANSGDAMPALYEKMLKTSVEEPERIKDIGYVLKMVTDKDIIPDEFRELYETFCNTLKIRR